MAVNLFRVTDNLPEEVDLAVVIAGEAITESKDQKHAGFLVKGHDGKLWLYDLAWHNWYRSSNDTEHYAYLIADFIDPFSANAIIGFLAVLLDATKGNIPYSIHYEDGSYFDTKTGLPLKNGLGQGLTCATFVLQVLERYGFEIVKKETWPLTPQDAEWQNGILDRLVDHTLRRTGVPESVDTFLVQFEKIGGVPRFRPEEAIGAIGIFEDEQLDYATVEPAAAEVLSELQRLNLS